MNNKELIYTRRSTRNYTDQEIDQNTLDNIFFLTQYAPSWKNSQIVSYRVIKDKKLKETIADKAVHDFVYNSNVIKECPLIVVQVIKKGISGKHHDEYITDRLDKWEMYDAGISAQTLCLSAWSYGVSSLIMGIVDDEVLRLLLDLNDDEYVGSIICLGYTNDKNIKAPKRKDMSEFVQYVK